ncbi:MAG: glycosyltransferase [Flexilinea sp.]|nr:glycosyltransferase [Flexilinea sp.]
MKVLLITSSLDAGGAEKWVRDTVLAMNREGIEFDYYFYEDIQNDSFLNDYKDAGVNLFFRELNKKTGDSKLNLKHDLTQFIQEHGPYNAAHINGLNLVYQFILVNVLHKAQIPVRIVHSHNSLSTYKTLPAKLGKWYLRDQIIHKSTVVGACSTQAGVTRYGNKIINNPKFQIIKNGIDLQKYVFNIETRNRIRTELGIGEQKVYLFIGRMAYPKNTLFLSEIYAAVYKRDPESIFILVGSGQDEEVTHQKINELGIGNSTIYVPWTSSPADYLCAGDVMLLPSLYEGFSFVTLEAQCAGIPCLVSDRIPREVNISGNVSYKSLNHSSDRWAETAMQLAKTGRYDSIKKIKDAGYDIRDTAALFRRMLEGKQA